MSVVARMSSLTLIGILVWACNEAPPPTPAPSDIGGLRPGATPTPRRTLPPASPTPTPSPAPTPTRYRVKSGDTLSAIARRFGVPLRRILRANPSITDPNRIEVGQIILIPPKGAPIELRQDYDVIEDDESDGVGQDGRLSVTPGYVDIHTFEARVAGSDLVVSLVLYGVPPNVAPGAESVTYRFVIDTDRDDDADWILLYSNTMGGGSGYGASLEDRQRGRTRTGGRVPGTIEVSGASLRWRVALSDLGDPEEIRLAARAERILRPGKADATSVVDDAPERQWPERDPEWLWILVQ